MSRIAHFMQNPVTGNDGYHLRAADAVEIEKFMNETKRALKGGTFFIRRMAEGDWIEFDEVSNKEQRTLLYNCMMRGYLNARIAQPEPINKMEAFCALLLFRCYYTQNRILFPYLYLLARVQNSDDTERERLLNNLVQ